MSEPPNTSADDGVVWERWNEVDALLDAALDVPRAERERFIVHACHGDLELLHTLRELIDRTEDTPNQLAAPGPALVRAAWSEGGSVPSAPSLEPGQRVGPYRIVGELGRGGMATVYEAERADGSFQRRMALKVLRRGVDTEDVVRRFLAERQILSGLTHPNIARLLDGGATTDGRPYLVIDLVEGEPITSFADRRRLSVRERLLLFLQVADAVHHAHQRLVVHRDLKPSNILVTADGQAKLLDFGIAKLLGPDTEDAPHTRAGVRPLTPRYASPEQLSAGPITTASDVYQLGILLHLLLAGMLPRERSGSTTSLDANGTGQFERPSVLLCYAVGVRTPRDEDRTAANLDAIADARGTSPEALRRSMHGDLDTILLKALRTEPDQRYDSALSLAEDVRRHLNGLPIAARPPSVPYRFRKFVFRNRWFTPVAALVLLGLLGFAYTRYRHDRQLERERNEARTQAERAEQLKEFMVGLFGSADPYAPADPARGRAITVVEALAVGAERARVELADRPVLRADLLSSIASVYENLDQREPALDLIDEVLEIRRQHELEPTAEFALELGKQANLLALTGRPDSAEAAFRRRLELERDLHGPDHPRVADALIGHSNHLFNRGEHQTALEHREQALQILRAAQPALRKELGDVLALLADSYRVVQRPADAERAAREALDILRDHLGEQHPSTAIARVHVAQVAHALGDIDTAIRLYREALPVLDRTLGPEHYNTLGSWNNLGIVYMDAEDYAGAEQVHRRMLEVRRRLSDGEDDHAVASSLQNLAVTLVRQTRFAEAESLSLRARDIYAHTTPEGHYLRAFPLLTIAEIRLLQRDGTEAERAARAAVQILRAALPAAHYATAAAECRLGAALALRGRLDDAKPLVAAALDVLQNNRQAPDRLVRECMATQQTLERGSSG